MGDKATPGQDLTNGPSTSSGSPKVGAEDCGLCVIAIKGLGRVASKSVKLHSRLLKIFISCFVSFLD